MNAARAPADVRAIWDLRRPERTLLLGCFLCILLGFLMVLGSSHGAGHAPRPLDLLPLVIYAGCLVAVHLVLVAARFQGDQVLPPVVSLLAGLGLLAQARMGAFADAGPWTASRYILPAGVLTMLAVCVAGMRGRYQRLCVGPWVWAGLSLAVVALLLVTGQRFRGGVYAAGFVTPTELLKVSVILFLAGFIDQRAKMLGKWGGLWSVPVPPFRELLPLMGFWALLTGLLFLQRDLGMFVVLSCALLAMLVVGTGRIGYLVYGLLGAAGFGYLILSLFFHGQRRIQAWLSPFDDPTGGGWQVLQGLSGMYSGGLWGEGFGRGNPEYTPIAESDFIYSVIGEELGFVGCALVLLFFLLFFERCLRIASLSASPFGRLLCAGLTTVIATQTFLNVGGVTKLIPLTGITLPFISQGGSSLVTAFASLGLILAISDGGTVQARGPGKTAASRRARDGARPKPARRSRSRKGVSPRPSPSG